MRLETSVGQIALSWMPCMPKIDIDYKVNIGSVINGALMIFGMIAAAIAYFADQRVEGQAVKSLQASVQVLQTADQTITNKITDAQLATANRLTNLETQNVFILRSLDQLETAIRERKL